MKKRIASLIFSIYMLLPLGLFAQEVVSTNQLTIYWIQSTSVGVLPGTYSYEVYTIPQGADKAIESNWVWIEEVTDLTYLTSTVTFTTEGIHIIGVRTKRLLGDGVTIAYSDMNWSDENGEDTPNPFVASYVQNPTKPTGLAY